jgi:hypothetical protein
LRRHFLLISRPHIHSVARLRTRKNPAERPGGRRVKEKRKKSFYKRGEEDPPPEENGGSTRHSHATFTLAPTGEKLALRNRRTGTGFPRVAGKGFIAEKNSFAVDGISACVLTGVFVVFFMVVFL